MNAAIAQGETEAGDEPRGRLDGLFDRRRLTGAQAAVRTRIVRRLRMALPLVAVILVAALLINTRSNGVDEAFLNDFADLDATPEELRMANPRFAGVDDKGFPYEITAEAALQAPGAQQRVELVNPRAVTHGADEERIVIADRGFYLSEGNILELQESVTMESRIGGTSYILRTPAATVAIGEETVRSTAGVEGEGDSGALRADRMHAYNSEGRVVFEGNVSMRIYPGKGNLSLKPGARKQAGENQETGEP